LRKHGLQPINIQLRQFVYRLHRCDSFYMLTFQTHKGSLVRVTHMGITSQLHIFTRIFQFIFQHGYGLRFVIQHTFGF